MRLLETNISGNPQLNSSPEKTEKAVPVKQARSIVTLFIFYKNVIFFLKPSKETEIATSKINTTFLIFEQFQGLMFL